jgi:hypothetical protein
MIAHKDRARPRAATANAIRRTRAAPSQHHPHCNRAVVSEIRSTKTKQRRAADAAGEPVTVPERRLISERTKAAMKRAKAKGVRIGGLRAKGIEPGGARTR